MNDRDRRELAREIHEEKYGHNEDEDRERRFHESRGQQRFLRHLAGRGPDAEGYGYGE